MAERASGYDQLEGYWTDDALSAFTGKPTERFSAPRGIIKNHAYAVESADPIKKTVTLANPHGPDIPVVTLTDKELHTPGISLIRTQT